MCLMSRLKPLQGLSVGVSGLPGLRAQVDDEGTHLSQLIKGGP